MYTFKSVHKTRPLTTRNSVSLLFYELFTTIKKIINNVFQCSMASSRLDFKDLI